MTHETLQRDPDELMGHETTVNRDDAAKGQVDSESRELTPEEFQYDWAPENEC